MTDKLFYKLWIDALQQPDKELYVAEYGFPEWFDEISTDPGKVVDILENIHDAAHMTVRDIIDISGMSKAAFARRFCIPIRTVENWVSDSEGKRSCAPYNRLAWIEALCLLDLGRG